jgi:hypothetical protein
MRTLASLFAFVLVACSDDAPSHTDGGSHEDTAPAATGAVSGYELCQDASTNPPGCPATLDDLHEGDPCTNAGLECAYPGDQYGVPNGTDARCQSVVRARCDAPDGGADAGAGAWRMTSGG